MFFFKIAGKLPAVVYLLCSMCSAACAAEDTYLLEAVTVTSRKSEEKVKEVPVSISVFDEMGFEDKDISDMEDMTYHVPNLNFNKIDSHLTQLNFRGIGGMTVMNKVWNVTIDGATIPYVALDTFFDMERVEVLRGSQGALYGRNTHAGVVNLITRGPESEFPHSLGLSYGTGNSSELRLITGTSFGENSGVRIAVKQESSDGFIENKSKNTTDANKNSQFSGRIKFSYSAENDLNIGATILSDSFNSNFDVYSPISNGPIHTTENGETGENRGSLFSPIITIKKSFAGIEFTSITNLSQSEYGFLLDYDYSPMDLISFDFDEKYNTWTQEFRINSKNSDSVFRWMGGLFFLIEDLSVESKMLFGSQIAMMGDPNMIPGMYMGAESTVKSNSSAAFGQVNFRFSPSWELTASLRIDKEKKKLNWTGTTGVGKFQTSETPFERSDEWTATLPAASLVYKLDEQQNVYFSTSSGYHAGDYAANQVDIKVVENPVDPEYTTTYELGYKGELLQNNLVFNAAMFYINWKDMQVSVIKDRVALFENAGKAHSMGVEADIRYHPVSRLDLVASIGIVNAEFDDYETNRATGENLKGNKIPNVNEYSVSLGVNYHHDSGVTIGSNVAYAGKKYLDEKNQYEQEPYTIINSKIGYEADDWVASLSGKNLLDERYFVHSFDTSGRAGDPLTVELAFNYFFSGRN